MKRIFLVLITTMIFGGVYSQQIISYSSNIGKINFEVSSTEYYIEVEDDIEQNVKRLGIDVVKPIFANSAILTRNNNLSIAG